MREIGFILTQRRQMFHLLSLVLLTFIDYVCIANKQRTEKFMNTMSMSCGK